MKSLRPIFQRALLIAAVLSVDLGWSYAQMLTGIPENAKEIRVDEKLGAEIPRDLVFQDELGHSRVLGSFVDENRPFILTLNYSDCPGLCVAQLEGLVQGIDGLYQLELGKDFEIVSISIDPRDTSERVLQMKRKYAKGISKPHQVEGWHFLTGSPESIAKITDAVGFRYTYDKVNDRYNHAAAAIFVSPKGKVTRYLYDVAFEPNTLKLALLEASEGKIGRTIDAFLLWCMHYSGTENRYSADARKLLSVAAGAFALALAGFISPFWILRRHSRTMQAQENHKSPEQPGSSDPTDLRFDATTSSSNMQFVSSDR